MDLDHSPHRPPGAEAPGDSSATAQLFSVLLSTPELEEFLTEVAGIAARTVTPPGESVPPAGAGDGDAGLRLSCGITLRRDSHPMTVVSSDHVAGAVDEAQYANGSGPCLESLATGRVVHVVDMGAEDRWGAYPAQALAHGVVTSLSLPLAVGGEVLGAMNLYSGTRGAFDAEDVRARAAGLAAQASAVLAVVLRHAQQTDLTESLRATMQTRSVIDQAIGIIMAQQRCPAPEAFAVLRAASQHRNRKLRDVAADVVTTASGHPPAPAPFTDPV